MSTQKPVAWHRSTPNQPVGEAAIYWIHTSTWHYLVLHPTSFFFSVATSILYLIKTMLWVGWSSTKRTSNLWSHTALRPHPGWPWHCRPVDGPWLVILGIGQFRCRALRLVTAGNRRSLQTKHWPPAIAACLQSIPRISHSSEYDIGIIIPSRMDFFVKWFLRIS